MLLSGKEVGNSLLDTYGEEVAKVACVVRPLQGCQTVIKCTCLCFTSRKEIIHFDASVFMHTYMFS